MGRDQRHQMTPLHKEGMRAQSSLEYLLVLSVLFAFLAVFIPVVKDAVEAAKFAAILEQERASFQRLIDLGSEAHALGKGSFLSEEIHFPAQTKLTFNPRSTDLSISFTAFNKTKILWKKISFNPRPLSKELFGDYLVKAFAEGEGITFEFKKMH
ncbi:hypothetical protein HY991_02330 [Candidatus Micrarchaeota archaeon]|nr:hypothetical protein [Candidatus Micrarchaeota archaeon]